MKRTRLENLPLSTDDAASDDAGTPRVVTEGIWHRTDRPKIVGLVGWLLTGVGYLGFILRGSQLPVQFGMDMRWLNPAYKPMPLNRVQFAVGGAILLADIVLGLFAIAAGIGTLRMREWGRRAVIAYAAVALVATLLKAAWQIHMFDFMLDYQASTTQSFDRERNGNASFFALVVMTALQLLWCAILASIMTRTYVKDAFARAAGPSSDAGDGWRSPATRDNE